MRPSTCLLPETSCPISLDALIPRGLMIVRASASPLLLSGLVNVVTGKGSEIGDYLVQHPMASLISFTGGYVPESSLAAHP